MSQPTSVTEGEQDHTITVMVQFKKYGKLSKVKYELIKRLSRLLTMNFGEDVQLFVVEKAEAIDGE